MLLHRIIRSFKSITQPPNLNPPSTSPNTSAEAPETVEASGSSPPIIIARAQAQAQAPTPTAENPADHNDHAQGTSAHLGASPAPHEAALSPSTSTSRKTSSAHPDPDSHSPSPSQASLRESTSPNLSLSHQTPAYEPDEAEQSEALTERHINLRTVPGPAPTPILTLVEATPFDDEIEIMQRKIWVKRPGQSATLVAVSDDDLVDTVRDMILRKYANSLGRSIDSPDITLKIASREPGNNHVPADRVLGPDEAIGQTLDSYYPGGQTIDEALVIDVPQRRTPKPSPRIGNHHPAIAYPYYLEDHRPGDGAREYFPPMAVHSPHLAPHPTLGHLPQQSSAHLPHSIGILQTGQVPALPSPGGHSTRKHRDGRPKYVRQHTSSPTIMHSSQPHSNGKTGTISS